MTKKEQAAVILEQLDEVMNIDWNFEDIYIDTIVKALNKIEE